MMAEKKDNAKRSVVPENIILGTCIVIHGPGQQGDKHFNTNTPRGFCIQSAMDDESSVAWGMYQQAVLPSQITV